MKAYIKYFVFITGILFFSASLLFSQGISKRVESQKSSLNNLVTENSKISSFKDDNNILRFYELLEEFNYTNLYFETSIHADIEKGFILQPKDEFESAEDYKKKVDGIERQKLLVTQEWRKKEYIALQEIRRKIKNFMDSTGLFSKPFTLESINNEPLTIQLGAYNFDKKSFPVTGLASTKIFYYRINNGSVTFSFVEEAKKFKEDLLNKKYKLRGQFRYALEPNGKISVIIETLKFIEYETGTAVEVLISDVQKQLIKSEIPLFTINKGRQLITGWSIGTQVRFNIVYSPDKKYMAFFENENPSIEIYNLYTGRIVSKLTKEYEKNLTGSGNIYSFLNLTGRFSSDGTKLVSWNPCRDALAHRNQEERVSIWDIESSKLINNIEIPKNDIIYSDISFDGSLLLTKSKKIGSLQEEIRVNELTTGKENYGNSLYNLKKYAPAITYNDVKLTFSIGANYILVHYPPGFEISNNIIDYKKENAKYKAEIDSYFLSNDFTISNQNNVELRYTVDEDRKVLTIWKNLDFSTFLKRDEDKTKTLIFENCSIEYPFYIRFRNFDGGYWGFGEGATDTLEYELFNCVDPSGDCVANPDYIGKKFNINYSFIPFYNFEPRTERVELISNAIIRELTISPIPNDFDSVFTLFYKALKEDNFNEAINYFHIPQDQGLFQKLDRKKILNEIKKDWKNFNWVDPNIRLETRNYFYEKSKNWIDVEGISVDFNTKDISLFFVKKDGQYKILSIAQRKESSRELTKSNRACNNVNDYLNGFSFQKTTFKNLDLQGKYRILKEFINEDFVMGSGYEYAFSIDLNNDNSPEYIFVTMIPLHGPLPISIISNVNNKWQEIGGYLLYGEFEDSPLWGLILLNSKTNSYYNLCHEGVKYKFNGIKYIQE